MSILFTDVKQATKNLSKINNYRLNMPIDAPRRERDFLGLLFSGERNM